MEESEFVKVVMRFPLSRTKQIEVRLVGHGKRFTEATVLVPTDLDMVLRQIALLKEQFETDLAEQSERELEETLAQVREAGRAAGEAEAEANCPWCSVFSP